MYIGIHYVGIAYIHLWWWQFRSSQIWIFYSSCFQMIENSKICVILPEVQNEPDVQRKVMRKGVHIKSILMQACVIFYSELEREFNIQYLSGYIFLYPKQSISNNFSKNVGDKKEMLTANKYHIFCMCNLQYTSTIYQGGRQGCSQCSQCSIGYTIFSGFVLYTIWTSKQPIGLLAIQTSGHPAI